MGPYHLLIGSLIDPSDDFCQSLRKSMISLIFFPGSLITLIYTIQLALALEATQAAITRFLADLILTLSFCAQYAYLRKKRHVSDLQAALLPWGIMLCLTIFFLNNCEYDNKSFAVTMSLVAVLLQIPKVGFFLVYCYVLAILHEWNISHLTEPDLLLVLPGAMKGRDLLQRFLSGLMGTSLIALGIYNFIRQVQELERRGAAQKAANEMTLSVLQRHKKYDTEGVSKILEESKLSKVVDPKFIKLFEEMNDNLEKYRPFLPNYLFLGVDDEAGDGYGGRASVAVGDADGASLILSDTPLAIFQMGSSDQEESTGDELSESGGESSSSPERASSFSSQSLGDSSHARDSAMGSSNTSSNPLENIPPPTSNIVVGGVTGLQLRQSKGGPTEGAQHFTSSAAAARSFSGVIAQAWIELQSNDWFSTKLVRVPFSSRTTRHQRNTLSVFTEALFDLAQTTKASVHSLVGDSVQLSWNATHRVLEPEQKAATFLLRLRQALASALPDVKLAAAACSGHAEVHSTTSHGTHQRAMYVDAPWLPALECCYTLAKRYKTLIVDGNIESRSCFAVVAQGVDCIRYVPKVVLVPGTAEPGMGSLEGPNPFNPKGFPLALPDTYDTLLGVQGPQQEEAAQTFLERKPVQHTIAYELVKRKEHEDDREENHDWLYSRVDQWVNGDDDGDGSRNRTNRKKEIEPLVTTALFMAADDRAAEAALFLVENGVFGAEGAAGGTTTSTETAGGASKNGTRGAVYESIFLNQDSADDDEFGEGGDPDYIPTSSPSAGGAGRKYLRGGEGEVYDPIAAAVALAREEAHEGQEQEKIKEKAKLPRNTLLLERLAKYCHQKTLPVGPPPQPYLI